MDAGGTAEPQHSTRCDYSAQQGALDQPHRALILPSDPALIPRARRDTKAAQRRAVSTSWASLHCTKTVVILCEYAVALKRVQKYTRSRGVGTGAPAMVVKALILSSMSAFLAGPAPFGVLLGLKSEYRQRLASSCRAVAGPSAPLSPRWSCPRPHWLRHRASGVRPTFEGALAEAFVLDLARRRGRLVVHLDIHRGRDVITPRGRRRRRGVVVAVLLLHPQLRCPSHVHPLGSLSVVTHRALLRRSFERHGPSQRLLLRVRCRRPRAVVRLRYRRGHVSPRQQPCLRCGRACIALTFVRLRAVRRGTGEIPGDLHRGKVRVRPRRALVQESASEALHLVERAPLRRRGAGRRRHGPHMALDSGGGAAAATGGAQGADAVTDVMCEEAEEDGGGAEAAPREHASGDSVPTLVLHETLGGRRTRAAARPSARGRRHCCGCGTSHDRT